MSDVTPETYPLLVAELDLLSLFDLHRSERPHDTGKGKRREELERRADELAPYGLSVAGPSADPRLLLEAFERVGRPRLERATGEGSAATVKVWRELERDLKTAAKVADLLDVSRASRG